MEEKLAELFKMTRDYNNKQDKYYAQINYSDFRIQKIEMSLREKHNHSFIRHYIICLHNDAIINEDEIIKLFKICIGNTTDK